MDEARPLDIEIGETGNIRVVQLRGELDLASVGRVTEVLEGIASDRVIVDLSGLSFIDSSGVAALVRTQQQMAAADQDLALTRPSRMVARVFEILGIASLLDDDPSDS
jgi:anti-sigma B factor antagonist